MTHNCPICGKEHEVFDVKCINDNLVKRAVEEEDAYRRIIKLPPRPLMYSQFEAETKSK